MDTTTTIDADSKVRIPEEIRARYQLGPGDELVIVDIGNGKVMLDFSPTHSLEDVRAAYDRNLPDVPSEPVDVKEAIAKHIAEKHPVAGR